MNFLSFFCLEEIDWFIRIVNYFTVFETVDE